MLIMLYQVMLKFIVLLTGYGWPWLETWTSGDYSSLSPHHHPFLSLHSHGSFPWQLACRSWSPHRVLVSSVQTPWLWGCCVCHPSVSELLQGILAYLAAYSRDCKEVADEPHKGFGCCITSHANIICMHAALTWGSESSFSSPYLWSLSWTIHSSSNPQGMAEIHLPTTNQEVNYLIVIMHCLYDYLDAESQKQICTDPWRVFAHASHIKVAHIQGIKKTWCKAWRLWSYRANNANQAEKLRTCAIIQDHV